jgi:asparagine synthase (glutamine-hydrolysing)
MRQIAYRRSGCGIVGAVGSELSDGVLARMTDTLAHRGPDARGTWVSRDGAVRFGHRRLAIVGVDERGVQPMTRGGYTVTCNGEVFNYPDLRAALERRGYAFTSDCDTEVLLHGYAEWGLDLLPRLNGIYAFGLYDEARRRVLLVRDRLGVKPLVTCRVGGGLLFASEAKALLAHPDVPRRANLDVIRADLLFGLLGPKQETWFAGVDNLEPGHLMLVDCATGHREVRPYWQAPDGPVWCPDAGEAAQALRAALTDAVRLQQLSDVGLAASVSGGVDSTAIAALALPHQPDGLDVFTLEYRQNRTVDEPQPDDQKDLHHAREAVRLLPGLRLREVPLSIQDLLDREWIDTAVRASDEYVVLDSRMLGMLGFYAAISASGHKVLLSGQGADETWLGFYDQPMYGFFRFDADRLTADHLATRFFGPRVPFGYPAWNPAFLDPDSAMETIRSNLARNYECWSTADPMNRLSQFIMRTHLQSLLVVDDRLAMTSGLEVRGPWLDHRLVELALRLPGELKLGPPGESYRVKWLLRQALRDIVPDPIRDRPKVHFPEPVPADAAWRALIREDSAPLCASPFLRELFAEPFLASLVTDPTSTARELYTVYLLWRFAEVNRLG